MRLQRVIAVLTGRSTVNHRKSIPKYHESRLSGLPGVDFRDSEYGASLILALVYIVAISLVVGALASWVMNDLNNTTHFQSASDRSYAATAAVDIAIANVRYNANAPEALPGPGNCWNPTSPANTTGLPQPVDGYTMAVWCSTYETATTLLTTNTRLVTFYVCEESTLDLPNPVAAEQDCQADPLLLAQVSYDDLPSGSTGLAATCTDTCGEQATVQEWIWGGNSGSATSSTTTSTSTTTTSTTTTSTTTTTTTQPVVKKLVIVSAPQSIAGTTQSAGTTSGSVTVQVQGSSGSPIVQSGALTVSLAYSAIGSAVTISSEPATLTIPSGSSTGSFTFAATNSSTTANESFGLTASAAGYTTSATQTETVDELGGGSTSTTIGSISGQAVAGGNNATYSVPIENTSTGTTHYYEVVAVNGLFTTGENSSAPSACLTVAGSSTGVASVTVDTSTSRSNGTYTLDFVVQRFSAAGCATADADYYQGDGPLTLP